MEGTLLLQQAEVEDAGDWDRVEIEAGNILHILYTYTSYTYTILYKLVSAHSSPACEVEGEGCSDGRWWCGGVFAM